MSARAESSSRFAPQSETGVLKVCPVRALGFWGFRKVSFGLRLGFGLSGIFAGFRAVKV